MREKAPESSFRLRTLLKVTGASGTDLAKLTGSSYALFLKVHGGERKMSLEYAELIMTATGVHPLWLLGERGTRGNPVTIYETPFTEETFNKWSEKGGRKFWLSQEVDKRFETVPRMLRRMAWELVRLAVASARSNKLYVLVYLFNKFIKETKKALGPKETDVTFLPFNPYNRHPNKSPLERYMIGNAIAADDEEAGYFAEPSASDEADATRSHQIVSTFNPVFLYELDEGFKAKQFDGLAKRFQQAEASLKILREHLVKEKAPHS